LPNLRVPEAETLLVTMPERLRLLVVASTFPSRQGDGTPEFVRDLSLRLGETFETVVLVPRVPGATRREQVGDVVIERFAYFPRRWEDLAHGAIIENLRARRSRWLQVVPFLLSEALHIRRLIGSHRPDILQLHWVLPQGLAALVTGRRVPWVVTTLGGDVYALRGGLSRRLKGAVLRRARAVTAQNEDMRRQLIDLGAPAAATYVQVPGADIIGMRKLVSAAEEPIPDRILFVGRLVEKKGVAVLLEALRRLPASLPWTLEIIGDGPLAADLKSRSAGLPVVFSGSASRKVLADAYARSSVVVVPSIPAASGDQDGLPTVLLEAMGAGRTVVASDLPGINEAVTDGETGLLVQPNDPDALASALGAALGDGALRGRLGAAAQRRSEDYTIEACSQRFVEILSEAATQGREAS
jgi:glycosyltransferase involved in cell wall biosynthesis